MSVSERTVWTVTYKKPPDVALRKIKAREGPQRKATMAMAEYWHDNYLPKHFQHGAGTKYHYQRRTKVYQIRKSKERGHRDPIKLAGFAEMAMKYNAKFVATSKRGKITMKGPWYLGHRRELTRKVRGRKVPTGKLSPDLPKEITTVTKGEVNRLAKVGRDTIMAGINAIRATRKKKLK